MYQVEFVIEKLRNDGPSARASRVPGEGGHGFEGSARQPNSYVNNQPKNFQDARAGEHARRVATVMQNMLMGQVGSVYSCWAMRVFSAQAQRGCEEYTN